MSHLSPENLATAREIIARYPRPKSALIPLLHLAQEQDGHVTEPAMRQIAELVGITPAEVLGTASFYEMFKLHPVGTYLVNICTNISCMLCGGEELLAHAVERLGVPPGGTTPDGTFTLEEVECIAACTDAPCAQVNYRYFSNLSTESFDRLLDDLAAGRLSDEVPPHGTLATVRQHIPAERAAGVVPPEAARTEPAWMHANEPAGSSGDGGAGR